jgi:hypothetical protein
MSESDASTRSSGDEAVMASIDHTAETSVFVIADVSTDDAWLSVPNSQARSLPDCR